MSGTTDGGQPASYPEASGMPEHQWVSDILRHVADTDTGRLRIAASLAADDLRRIWHWTERRATARDRRTHHIVRQELSRRGLLGPAGVPAPREAPDAI
jgi:hypothetical protein